MEDGWQYCGVCAGEESQGRDGSPVCAQTGALAEIVARGWGGVRARNFLIKELGACGLSLSLTHVIFFYVL